MRTSPALTTDLNCPLAKVKRVEDSERRAKNTCDVKFYVRKGDSPESLPGSVDYILIAQRPCLEHAEAVQKRAFALVSLDFAKIQKARHLEISLDREQNQLFVSFVRTKQQSVFDLNQAFEIEMNRPASGLIGLVKGRRQASFEYFIQNDPSAGELRLVSRSQNKAPIVLAKYDPVQNSEEPVSDLAREAGLKRMWAFPMVFLQGLNRAG